MSRHRLGWLIAGASALALSGAASTTAGLWHRSGGSTLQPAPAAAAKLDRARREIDFLTQRVERQPDDTEGLRALAHAWLLRARLSANGAEYDRAIEVLDRAEREEPGSLRLLGERVRILSTEHRFVAARRLVETGLARSPDDGQLLGLAGDAALYSGDLAAAERYYRHFREVDPKSPSALIGLAFRAELDGDLEQAAALIGQAPQVGYPMPLSDERYAYVHAVLGEIRSKQGQLGQARTEFETALKHAPEQALALSGLANLELWQGRDAEAETLLRGLVARESPNADYALRLAEIRARHGGEAEARRLRREAEAFYSWSVASGNDGYLRPLAALRLAARDYRTAAELSLRDLAERPTAESRVIFENVLQRARAAGQPLDKASLQKHLDDRRVASNS